MKTYNVTANTTFNNSSIAWEYWKFWKFCCGCTYIIQTWRITMKTTLFIHVLNCVRCTEMCWSTTITVQWIIIIVKFASLKQLSVSTYTWCNCVYHGKKGSCNNWTVILHWQTTDMSMKTFFCELGIRNPKCSKSSQCKQKLKLHNGTYRYVGMSLTFICSSSKEHISFVSVTSLHFLFLHAAVDWVSDDGYRKIKLI